jgi:hypothetical protein
MCILPLILVNQSGRYRQTYILIRVGAYCILYLMATDDGPVPILVDIHRVRGMGSEKSARDQAAPVALWTQPEATRSASAAVRVVPEVAGLPERGGCERDGGLRELRLDLLFPRGQTGRIGAGDRRRRLDRPAAGGREGIAARAGLAAVEIERQVVDLELQGDGGDRCGGAMARRTR